MEVVRNVGKELFLGTSINLFIKTWRAESKIFYKNKKKKNK